MSGGDIQENYPTLLHAAGLLRAPDRYIEKFGKAAAKSCLVTACGTSMA